mmetsp:Transcript_7553/g.12984  ORF Transcript_7553/g.12984 Transcript_7553/m.12984 type:complete len:203 (+) Transcript_7553:627-1235(+)
MSPLASAASASTRPSLGFGGLLPYALYASSHWPSFILVHMAALKTAVVFVSPVSTRASAQLIGASIISSASIAFFTAVTCSTTAFKVLFSGRSSSNRKEPFTPPAASCNMAWRTCSQEAVTFASTASFTTDANLPPANAKASDGKSPAAASKPAPRTIFRRLVSLVVESEQLMPVDLFDALVLGLLAKVMAKGVALNLVRCA